MLKDKKNWFYILTLIILGFLIYSNTFQVPFQFDDFSNIKDNSFIHNLGNFTKLQNLFKSRIVGYLTFAVNYFFSKENTFSYHLVNLIIHIANSILVFIIAKKIFSIKSKENKNISLNSQTLAFLSSLIFLTHPIQTQAVTYIVQRFSSLAAFFYFLSILIFTSLINQTSYNKKIFYSIQIFMLFFLAIFTKENSITLPILILVYYYYFFSFAKNNISIKKIIPILIIFLFFGILLMKKMYHLYIFAPRTNYQNELVTPTNYLITQFRVVPKYLQLLFFPINQSIDHLIPISSQFNLLNYIGIFIILLLSYLSIKNFKKNKIISFSIFWFFVTLSIESSIIPLADPSYEHRLYLPMFGFSLFLINLIYKLSKNSISKTKIIIILISIIFSILTFRRNKVWNSEESLWQNVVSQYPQNKRALNNLSVIYFNQQKYQKSLEYINKILIFDPKYSYSFYNLGRIYLIQNNNEKALESFHKAENLGLKNSELYIYLGNLYLNLSDNQNAKKYLQKALYYNKNYDLIYTNLALINIQEKQYEQAKNFLELALENNPNYYEAYANLGIVYVHQNDLENAIKNFQKAIELNPNDQNSKSNLKKAKELIQYKN